jgi:hypothetical protein
MNSNDKRPYNLTDAINDIGQLVSSEEDSEQSYEASSHNNSF